MGIRVLTISEYIESKTGLREKINAYNALIDAMLAKATDAITDAETHSFRMDDGQVIIQTELRDPDSVFAAVDTLERIKQRYVNRYNGHRTILRSRLNNGRYR